MANPEHFDSKNKQMLNYLNWGIAILVLKEGYNHMPYCTNNGYHMISHKALPLFLEVFQENIFFNPEVQEFVIKKDALFGSFVHKLSENLIKCPHCGSSVFTTFIYNCHQYNLSFHPDYIDIDETLLPTYWECDGCGQRRLSENMFNYNNCPFCQILHKYQCNECGAIFNRDSKEIVNNLEDSHKDSLKMDYPKGYFASK